MKLLIIGGTGFLGRHLTALALDWGHDIAPSRRRASRRPCSSAAHGSFLSPPSASIAISHCPEWMSRRRCRLSPKVKCPATMARSRCCASRSIAPAGVSGSASCARACCAAPMILPGAWPGGLSGCSRAGPGCCRAVARIACSISMCVTAPSLCCARPSSSWGASSTCSSPALP